MEPVTTAQQQIDDIEDCQNICDALFELAVANSTNTYRICASNALIKGLETARDCNSITDPDAQEDCYDAARATLLDELEECLDAQRDDDLDAIAAWEACMEACFA